MDRGRDLGEVAGNNSMARVKIICLLGLVVSHVDKCQIGENTETSGRRGGLRVLP